MIHLDTTFLVDLLRERADNTPGPAYRFLEDHGADDLALSVHVACELMAGVACAENPETERERVAAVLQALPVVYPGEGFAHTYAVLYAELRRRGEKVPAMDLLIASAARAVEAKLVTRNVRDFERIPGLHVLSY